jgi:hypothetical protein
LITRAMRPEDRRFIVPTWVRSLATHLRVAPHGKHWRAVDRVLDATDTRVIVLASDQAARTIHAWAAATGDALQYAYVPPELRREGLARQCITALFGSYPERIAVTHAWPFASERFYLQPHRLLRAA